MIVLQFLTNANVLSLITPRITAQSKWFAGFCDGLSGGCGWKIFRKKQVLSGESVAGMASS